MYLKDKDDTRINSSYFRSQNYEFLMSTKSLSITPITTIEFHGNKAGNDNQCFFLSVDPGEFVGQCSLELHALFSKITTNEFLFFGDQGNTAYSNDNLIKYHELKEHVSQLFILIFDVM